MERKISSVLLSATLFLSVNAFAEDPTNWLIAVVLIGKKAEFQTNMSPLYQDEGLVGSTILPKPATDLTVSISDPEDNIIKNIDLGPYKGAGLVDFKWDGKDAAGHSAKPDFYKISATATINGKQVKLATAGAFKVTSVSYDQKNNKTILGVDGLGSKYVNELIKII